MSDEARKEHKVKAKALKVKYKSATLEDFIVQYAKDISRSGMWIKTPKPPALGELLKIEIQLKDETPVLKAAGRVVQRREEAEARPDAPPGMGVRFLKVEEGFEVIERIMVHKGGDEAGPHFESLRPAAPSVAPPAGIDARSGDFFGNGPAAPLPAEQDQTVMRQMNALLGEALRIAKTPSQPSPPSNPAPAEPAKPVESVKATMVGMGNAEAREAVAAARAALTKPAEAAKIEPVKAAVKAAPEPAKEEAAKATTPPAAAKISSSSVPKLSVGSDASRSSNPIKATLEFTSSDIAALATPSNEPPPGTVPMTEAMTDESTQRASRGEIDAALRAMRELPDDPPKPSKVEAKPEPVVEKKPEPVVEKKPEPKVDEPLPSFEMSLGEDPVSAATTTVMPAVVDEDGRVTAVPAKKGSADSISALIEESVAETRPTPLPDPMPAPVVAPIPPRAEPASIDFDVDAKPKKRNPVVLYATIGVVLVVGAVAAFMMRGGDTPAPTPPAPVVTPPPAPTPPEPTPARQPPPPVLQPQVPAVVPAPTVQPPPPSVAEPTTPPAEPAHEPTRTPEPAPVPAVVPLPAPAPVPAPAPAPVPAAAPDPTPPAVNDDPPARPVRPAVRPAPRPVVRPAPAAPRPAAPAADPTPAPAPAPAPRPAAPRPVVPPNGAVPPNPFE